MPTKAQGKVVSEIQNKILVEFCYQFFTKEASTGKRSRLLWKTDYNSLAIYIKTKNKGFAGILIEMLTWLVPCSIVFHFFFLHINDHLPVNLTFYYG